MEVNDHPGCYGLPTAVSAKAASCQSCPHKSPCVAQARVLLEALPNNPLTRRERLALTVTHNALVGSPQGLFSAGFAGFPARVAKQLESLAQCGWFEFAKNELRMGRNPGEKGWKRVFCDLLLQKEGCDRRSFELALVERLDLSPASARVQASVGISIFAAGRIATERFGRLQLLPN